MESGKKYPLLRPLFIPVLPPPSGDRFVATAIYEALKKTDPDGFAVAAEPIEAFDASGKVKSFDTLAQEVETAVKTVSVTHPHKPVLFYTSNFLIDYLKDFNTEKFASTHRHPERLYQELRQQAHVWEKESLKNIFGLDMLCCPVHAAADGTDGALHDPNILWMFGVPSHKAPLESDLSEHALFKEAVEKPFFVVSLPADDPVTNKKMRDLLIRVIHHEESLGERTVVLVDNPRSRGFKADLLDALQKDYPVVSAMGSFTNHVLPAIAKNALSKLFLPGDSAIMIAESIQVLAPHQIIVNGACYKNFEQEQLVPFYFDRGYIHVLDEERRILKPHAIENHSMPPAYQVAAAALEKFVHHAVMPAATYEKRNYGLHPL